MGLTLYQRDHCHLCDLALDELRAVEHPSDRGHRVPRVEHAGAGLEQQRRHEEVVVATDEGDLDVGIAPEQSLEVPSRVNAPEPATQDDNAACA
jgi:hypothetical protein